MVEGSHLPSLSEPLFFKYESAHPERTPLGFGFGKLEGAGRLGR